MTWWSSSPHETLDRTREYVRGNAEGEQYFTWAITEDGGEALGWVVLIAKREGVAEIGYNLRRSHWRKGYASEAVARIVEHGFSDRGLRRIIADTDPDNAGSNAVLEKLGFQREGYLREEWETHIGVRDSIIWGLLKRDWRMLEFFKQWLPQIIGYAELIADEAILRRCWLEGDRSQTSVIDPGELDEQIFGDLHSNDFRAQMQGKLQTHPDFVESIDDFLSGIETLCHGSQIAPAKLLQSREWQQLQETARGLIVLANAAGFSSEDFNSEAR